MARRNFYDIIKNSGINLQAEYTRIYKLFYEGMPHYPPVAPFVDRFFVFLPDYLVGRAVSYSDYINTYNFNFSGEPEQLDVDYLISFCEYVQNLCDGIKNCKIQRKDNIISDTITRLTKLIYSCMEDMGQMPVTQDNLLIFVPKNSAAVAVMEIVNEDLALTILEYHHYRLKGNLAKKKSILKTMADDIEASRGKLKEINRTLETQLFQMLNKFVRHDHSKTPYIETMSDADIEQCYDDIYQMWLLAKLELDHLERKKRVEGLLSEINS